MLVTIPLLFVLAGLILYTVLGGADFGAGIWRLAAGADARGRAVRDHAHHAMAPVWEANHVWLIFALTVAWTAYPAVVGAVASTLTIPLSVAALGIIARGLAYALQSATEEPRERRLIDLVFAFSSVLTPFMLGAAVGAIAAGRVPIGNAAGSLVTSWLNPTAVLCGCLAVAIAAFLAAVYLAADARRLGATELERAFRARSMVTALVAGAVAVAGLVVAHSNAHHLYAGLTTGWGLAAVVVSAIAGVATAGLVWRERYQLARLSAAVAVAAVLAGWAAAQRPHVLPGLTLRQAAAADDTLVALILAVLLGGLILAPSLAVLFRLVLAGGFDPGAAPSPSGGFDPDAAPSPSGPESGGAGTARGGHRGRNAQLGLACLVVGLVLLTLADPPAAHAVGVCILLAAAGFGFAAVHPDDLAAADLDSADRS